MVLGRSFHCPTQVIHQAPFEDAVGVLINGRRWSLMTSSGWVSRGVVDRIVNKCTSPDEIIHDIGSNPTLSTVVQTAEKLKDIDVVVALGGGSVIDAAKGAVALKALGHDLNSFFEHLRDGTPLPDTLNPLPIIAIPTTSGTGAEVTRWGTIWGDDGLKHSVTDPSLYPSHAIMDPELCTSMGRDLTLITALDALSHAMESIWNRNNTPITDALATLSIQMIRENLELTLAEPGNANLRRNLQTAALLSGFAMGTTQTALAHSISYPFTSRFGVPHGLACSFTLPAVARYNISEDSARLAPIAEGLGCSIEEIPEFLSTWFRSMRLGEMLSAYLPENVADGIDNSLITRARAANNMRDVDGAAAREIVRHSIDMLKD